MDILEIKEAELAKTEQAFLGDISEDDFFGSLAIMEISNQNTGFTDFNEILNRFSDCVSP